MVDARTALAQSDTLRLIWPQWQGAGETSVRSLLPELPYGRHGASTHWEPGC